MNKSYFWASCVMALLGAAYYGLRAGPAESSYQPSNTPLAGSGQSVPNQAMPEPLSEPEPKSLPEPTIVDARNEQASTHFREMQQCFSAAQEFATAKANADDCKKYEGLQEYEHAHANCLNDRWSQRAADAERKQSECGSVTNIERKYYEATRDAAKAGDADAQLCYLQAAFSTRFSARDNTSPLTDADVAEYKQVSSQYLDTAIKRGDWRIAQLLTRRNFHPGSGPITQLGEIGKPETIYKMTKLMRLGASGSFATGQDYKLKLLMNPDIKPSEPLPQETIDRADAWAQETYIAYFSGVHGLTELPTVCDLSS